MADPLYPSLITSIIPIAIGGISVHFKLFIESPNDFRKRIQFKRDTLIEKHALQHTDLLQHLRSIVGTDSELRGDGKEARDLVGDFSADTFRLFIIFTRLEFLRWIFGVAYSVMLISIIAGICGALIAWLFAPARDVVLIASLSIIVLQLVMILVVFFSSRKLEGYEDVA